MQRGSTGISCSEKKSHFKIQFLRQGLGQLPVNAVTQKSTTTQHEKILLNSYCKIFFILQTLIQVMRKTVSRLFESF